MMRAACKGRLCLKDDAVRRYQIVTEHGDGRAAQPFKRVGFEFEVQTVRAAETLRDRIQSLAVLTAVPMPVPAQEDIKLDIIIRLIPAPCPQNPTLSSSVSTSQHDRLQLP